MKLFYTVVSHVDDPQNDPTLSLGGYKSSTPVPNTTPNSLFSDISAYTIQHGKPEYLGLILQNTMGFTAKRISIWVSAGQEESYCKYEVAAVVLTADNQMERISNMQSRPFYAEFYPTSESDRIELEGDMEDGAMLGLWISRSLDVESEALKNWGSCDFLFSQFEKGIPNEAKKEGFSVKVEFFKD